MGAGSYITHNEAYLYDGEWFQKSEDYEDSYINEMEPALASSDYIDQVEYDADQQDLAFVQLVNYFRSKEGLKDISIDAFEICMDSIEKYMNGTYYFPQVDSQRLAPHGGAGSGSSDDGACAVCGDTEGEDSNMIVFCDGCNVSVHQECYGIPHVPEGAWLCQRCALEGQDQDVRCVLCPNEGGALKKTTTGDWAHLVCALWIPETGVLDPTHMEPIDGVAHIPRSRWGLRCAFCKTKNGAAIQCNERTCTSSFHVTCAQKEGIELLMKSLPQESLAQESAAVSTHQHSSSSKSSSDGPADYSSASVVTDVTGAPTVMKAYCFRHESPIVRSRREERIAKEKQQQSKVAASDDPSNTTSDDTTNKGSLIQKVSNNKPKEFTTQQQEQQQFGPPRTSVPTHVFSRLKGRLEARLAIKDITDILTSICRYWSLKREARRGIALNRRLALENASREMPLNSFDYNMRSALLAKGRDDAQIISNRISSLLDTARESAQVNCLIANVVRRGIAPLPQVAVDLLQYAKKIDLEYGLFNGGAYAQQTPLDLSTVETRFSSHMSVALLIKDLYAMYDALQQSYPPDSDVYLTVASERRDFERYLAELRVALPDPPHEAHETYYNLLVNTSSLKDVPETFRKYSPELYPPYIGLESGSSLENLVFPPEFVPPRNILDPSGTRSTRLVRDPLKGFRPVSVELEVGTSKPPSSDAQPIPAVLFPMQDSEASIKTQKRPHPDGDLPESDNAESPAKRAAPA